MTRKGGTSDWLSLRLREVTEMWNCPHCDTDFSDTEAVTVVIPDDRDQMYGRPLGGYREVVACPVCGHTELEDIS